MSGLKHRLGSAALPVLACAILVAIAMQPYKADAATITFQKKFEIYPSEETWRDVVEIKSKKPGRMNVTLIFANQTGGRWTDFLMSITSKGDGFNKAKKPSSNKFSSFSMTPTRLKWFDGEVLDKKSVKFKFSVTQNSDRKLTLAVLPTIKRGIDDTRETHAPLPTAVLLLASGCVGVLAVRRKWGR